MSEKFEMDQVADIKMEINDFFDVDKAAQDITEQYLTEKTKTIDDQQCEKIIPAKSKTLYEQQYEKFIKWCKEKNLENFTENVMLVYFNDKLKLASGTTLWAYYSMLKTMLNIKHNIDIGKYPKLIALLKKRNEGHKPKMARVLTSEQVEQFLMEAPNERYLMDKVVLILGVAGACTGNELTQLSTKDVTDLGSTLLFTITNRKNERDRNFVVKNSEKNSVQYVEVCKKYMALRKSTTPHSRFFVQYRDRKCTVQPVGKNTLGKVPQKIAGYLNLPHTSEYTGHSFRRTSASMLATAESTSVVINRFGGRKSEVVSEECVENSVDTKQGILDHEESTTATTAIPPVESPPIATAQTLVLTEENNRMFNLVNCKNVEITVHIHQK